jgi:flagellar motility protein MotE (MotC chaperone)
MSHRNYFQLLVVMLFVVSFSSSSIPAETVDLTPNGELQDKTAAPSPPQDAGQLLSAIEKRKVDLDKRAEEIEQESQRLQSLKTELNLLLGRYTQAKESASKSETIDLRQLEQLSKIYESMPPKDAARRIERLKEPLAIKLLSNIKPKVASKILNEISPVRAAYLTEKLAKSAPPQQAAAP